VQRDLAWDGCLNARDLGGLPTPGGATAFRVFVRSDNARNLTAAGWRAAAEYGIATVLDLRSEPECMADPPPQQGFTHRRLSLFEHFDGDEAYRVEWLTRLADAEPAERHRALYREALALDAERFGDAVGALAAADGGVLVHCVAGKDRTGVLAALLLRLVGVPVEAIEEDYVRSEAPMDVMGPVLAEIEARHGSVAAYLQQAGAKAAQLERIRRRLAPDG
jgi:protein-tyrosine phosphatase